MFSVLLLNYDRNNDIIDCQKSENYGKEIGEVHRRHARLDDRQKKQ